MTAVLEELFKHNLWANERLLDACAGLSEAQLAATVPGTYDSILATLNHIVGAEEGYLRRLGNQPAPPRDERLAPVAELRERSRRSGVGLVALAANPPDGRTIEGEWRGTPYSMPAAIPMIQAINHATDHRSQIATILTQHGITPPDLDAWAYRDAQGQG